MNGKKRVLNNDKQAEENYLFTNTIEYDGYFCSFKESTFSLLKHFQLAETSCEDF